MHYWSHWCVRRVLFFFTPSLLKNFSATTYMLFTLSQGDVTIAASRGPYFESVSGLFHVCFGIGTGFS